MRPQVFLRLRNSAELWKYGDEIINNYFLRRPSRTVSTVSSGYQGGWEPAGHSRIRDVKSAAGAIQILSIFHSQGSALRFDS